MLVLIYTCQKICDKKLYVLSTISIKGILPKEEGGKVLCFLGRKDENEILLIYLPVPVNLN